MAEDPFDTWPMTASGDDDRRHCFTCARFSATWCAGGSKTPRFQPITDLPRRCLGYVPSDPDDPDQRKGHERWPHLIGIAKEAKSGNGETTGWTKVKIKCKKNSVS